jgi:hypothetical protein
MPAIAANVTNTVAALWPGIVAACWQRRDFDGAARPLWLTADQRARRHRRRHPAPSTPASSAHSCAAGPALILMARRAARRLGPCAPGSSTAYSRCRPGADLLVLAAAAIYGGCFGAGSA